MKEIWFLTSELEGERAGSFRQTRWAEIFLALGARLVIFNIPDGGALRLTIAECNTAAEFAAFRQRALGQFKPMASIREGWKVRHLRRIKHLLLVDLYYPNIFKLVSRAHRRLATTQHPVVIMGSSPPFSLAFAGAILKRLHPRRVVLAIDMRDGWAMSASLGGWRPLKKLIERAVLRQADAVSTVAHGLKEQFAETYDLPSRVLYNVATHYFSLPPAAPVDWVALNPTISPARLKVVYTGSTPPGYYDLDLLARALRELHDKNPSAVAAFQLIFVGACDEFRRTLVQHRIEDNQVVFVPHVAHPVARAIQQQADAMIFLTYVGRGAVSTKIFEYLALGKPIFPIDVPRGDDADRLLRRYGGSSLNLHTPEEVSAALARLASPEEIARLPRAKRPEDLRELVDDYRSYAQELLHRAVPCSDS